MIEKSSREPVNGRLPRVPNGDDAGRSLQHVVGSALRELPNLRAPATLEGRVIAQLHRWGARPWWQLSFTHWPLAARGVFLMMCTVFVGLALDVRGWTDVMASWPWSGSVAVSPIQHVLGLLSALGALVAASRHIIPPPWAYAALGTAAALYTMLFALGTVAYQTLYRTPCRLGENP